ncbi:cytochrome P450 [Helicostylum pulchrum]|nr:cytochrome P450 [Helicostylum pulchrum]
MPVKLFGKITQQLFETMDTMDETINVSDMMIRLLRLRFDFDAVRNNNSNKKWTYMYYSLGNVFGDYKYFIFPSLDQKLLWLFLKRRELHRKLDAFMDLEENERDLLTLMLESEEKGEGALSNEELKSNLCVFFLAGHDTTAAAITFALHYLAKYPEIQQREREEAISILGNEPNDVLPVGDETKQINYINQVIKESLRISDPVARLFIPRIPTEDTMLSGTFIPKGAKLVTNIFNVHHSSKCWKNPRQFDLDRFGINAESEMAWVPFGSGARQCIGKYFSLNEQRVIKSMLLRKYTWTLPDDSIHKDEIVT